jgi:hypothetical protein
MQLPLKNVAFLPQKIRSVYDPGERIPGKRQNASPAAIEYACLVINSYTHLLSASASNWHVRQTELTSATLLAANSTRLREERAQFSYTHRLGASASNWLVRQTELTSATLLAAKSTVLSTRSREERAHLAYTHLLSASVSSWPVRQTELTSAKQHRRCKQHKFTRGACPNFVKYIIHRLGASASNWQVRQTELRSATLLAAKSTVLSTRSSEERAQCFVYPPTTHCRCLRQQLAMRAKLN